MYKEHVTNALTDAGADGVEQTELFTEYRGANAAIALTNTLAQMRRDGDVVLRRDGESRKYYLPEHAPAIPQPPASE